MDQSSRSPSESKDRAVSPDPCSTRPNPFDDDDGTSARKRRRTSLNGASPSRSVETTPESARAEAQGGSVDRDINMTLDSSTSIPHTPEHKQDEAQPPVSETRHTKITLNLKKGKQASDFGPSSLPGSPNGYGAQENGIRASVEDSDLDLPNTSLDFADAASSSADVDNHLPIEIIDDDEDDDQGPSQITLLEDPDPITSFPNPANQPLLQALHTICQHLPNGHHALALFRGWLEDTIAWVERQGLQKLYIVFREYRDFWHALPSFVLQYSSPSRTTIARNHQTQQLLAEFHSAFSRLTAVLVEADRNLVNVENVDEDWQGHISTAFVTHFSSLLTEYGAVMVPNAAICDPEAPWPEPINRIVSSGFLSDPSVAPAQSPMFALYDLGFAAAGLISRSPKCTDVLQPILCLASFVACGEFTRQQADAVANGFDQTQVLFEQTYELYDVGACALAGCIEKSVNQIQPLVAIDSISHLTDLLRICFRSDCRQTQTLMREHQEKHPAIPRAESAKVIVAEWRLTMYTKLIMSSQMQLRISAAQQMSSDLVRIWRENHRDNHEPIDDLSQQPILRHFSNQILQSGVVAYLLGPSCHPEVTAQSSNIIGFLFASHTFTEDLMDLMWRTITTCQISGVPDSLLTTVASIANLFSPVDFFNVFRKLQTVSIENFTPTMKDFCDKVLAQLIDKNNQLMDVLPYSLMFRLLRESSVPGPHFSQTIQKWASTLISQLLRLGPSSDDRLTLQHLCLEDIIQKTPYTLGSLHGLSLLIRPVSRERDLLQLTAEHNLTRLLVDELEHAINTRQDAGILHAISGPENAPRLELLITVISHAQNTDSISDDLGRRLWELLVGERAASQEDRDCAWQSLCNAMKAAPGNPFLQTCFIDYFPTLAPGFFRPGSLDFVLHRILPLLNRENSFILEDDEPSDHLALEQLWRIALTAPSGTIEVRAITALVKDVYMDNRAIQVMPLYRARRVHLGLVNRCLRQLSSAARQLASNDSNNKDEDGDTKVLNVDAQDTADQALLFTRSLTIVREFHKVHQQTPRFSSPDLRSLPLPEKNDMEGDPAELKYQSFDGGTQTDVKPLTIGRQNTAGSLLASIRQATGFENYRMYYKGHPFNPTEQDVCKSLEELQIHSGLILVKREADDQDEHPVFSRHGASPVEIEIMRHFSEMWQYLDLKQQLANEIYAFLITLPVDDHILDLLRDEVTSYEKIFPIGHPLKSLYALHAMKEYLSSHCSQPTANDASIKYEGALRRLLQLVVSAISDPDVIDTCSDADLKFILALRLVEQFSAILRDPLRPESSNQLLDQPLIGRLVDILSFSLTTEPSFTANLVIVTLQGIMDMCSLRQELWGWLSSNMDLRNTVQRLLIDDARDAVRKSTGSIIIDKTTVTLSSSEVLPAAFAKVFWPLLMDLIPHALSQPTRSLEAFNLAAIILASAKESGQPILDLRQIAQSLCTLLIEYDPSEIPGMALTPFPSQDVVQPGAIDICAHGLVQLLHMILCGDNDKSLLHSIPENLGLALFSRLFPRRWGGISDLLWCGGVIYNETTRFRLNDIVIRLIGRDRSQLKRFLCRLDSLVPCLTDDEAEDVNQYRYDLPYYFDRAKDIRGACGYAGLRNLSNTCYLNSLCTQLFMNVEFRRFVLSVEVDTRDRSRTLLHETQAMFAHLQSSQRRFFDPERFVASIKTYDDDCINIHNQMDVEEFFNLLNDRWEGQLRSHDAVRRFRSFYGGQLVTQTKSKECEHISEVLEPFSAIQCDIKGKKTLFESLEAYVDGEHMEGDNKYKCSTCDRHVDAVRRSCLKEIPDSLIFHLKRFDFNLRTQSRSKINDYFAFPNRINMRPYTVEYLSNSPEGFSEDWFELVGVLVHAGTAESGHYYSFIRERPSSRKEESWFEFNDDVVSPWCPSKMEACCFGGTETWDSGGVMYDKNYCAYMLFYERSSKLEHKQRVLQTLGKPSPIQSEVPLRLAQELKEDNLRVLQRHCLFDPDHLRLLDETIDRMLALNGSQCSHHHDVEDLAVWTAISHLDQIASRGKDVHEAQKLANRIRDLVSNCQRCAFAAFRYFDSRHEPFRMLVQRNPEVVIRQSIPDLVCSILCSLRQDGTGTGQSEDFAEEIVDGICGMLGPIWGNFHVANNHKSWPQVFELMARVVEFGKEFQLGFMDLGFFQKTLLIFLSHYEDEPKRDPQFTKLCNILNRRPNRSPNYASAIELLKVLLMEITPDDPVEESDDRRRAFERDPSQKIRLTLDEKDLLDMVLTHTGNALLDRVISLNQNIEATDEIIQIILERQWELETDVLQTLVANTTPLPQESILYKPYLRAAAVFCHHSRRSNNVSALINHIAKSTKILAMSEPKAVWCFFRDITGGDREKQTDSEIAIQKQSLKVAPDWAPPLLANYDTALGTQVEMLLNDKIFSFGPTPQFDPDDGGEERAEAIVNCAKSLGIKCCEYVNQVFIRRSSAISTQSVAILQRIIMQCGLYFDNEDALVLGGQNFPRASRIILEHLRRLSVDDLEDDGSDWENSGASSDQAESLVDDEMKDLDA